MFSEVAEIALVAARLGQFQQLLKTRLILILNFTRPHAITYTNHKKISCTIYLKIQGSEIRTLGFDSAKNHQKLSCTIQYKFISTPQGGFSVLTRAIHLKIQGWI